MEKNKQQTLEKKTSSKWSEEEIGEGRGLKRQSPEYLLDRIISDIVALPESLVKIDKLIKITSSVVINLE